MLRLERCSYGLDCPMKQGEPLLSIWRIRSLDDVLWYIGEQKALDDYLGYQGKIEHFWCLQQAGKTRQVLEATSSVV